MQITKEHITKIHSLLDHGLVSGMGNPEPGKMCVEAAICYALDLPHGDDPGVAPALRQLKIRLNDSTWSSNKARAEGMRRLAIAQLGSKDVLNEQEFATRVARMTIQTVIPTIFRQVARLLTGEHPTKLLVMAAQCESEPTEANAHTAADAAAGAARTARTAAGAAYAAAAAYAARTARTAAYAAAAADAARIAAYAAYAARTARTAAYAAAARTAAYAAAADAARAADAASDESLVSFAENVVQILIEMKAPGCQWLEV